MSGSLLGLAIPDVAPDPAFVEWLEAAIDGDGAADAAAEGTDTVTDRAAGNGEPPIDLKTGRGEAADRTSLDTADAPTRRTRRADPCPEHARDVAHLTAAFLAVEPVAVRRHRRLGLPDEVTAATLADVGRKIDAYGASADLSWLVGLARGDVIALGRLQFERWAAPEGRALHIPEGGPLDPRAVDDSLRQARELFGAGPIVCHTWLFDPALRTLPASSNIVAFAQRFDVLPTATGPDGEGGPQHADPAAADHAVAKFVFRRPLSEVLDPALVHPHTAVERIVADRLRSGAHWSEPHGLLRG